MKKIYNSKFKLLALVLGLFISSFSYAQSVSVSGKLTGEDGAAIPGATVLEKGTANGTVTDQNGQYTIQVSSGSATLVFSFIGYKTTEVGVGGRTVVDVALGADITSLQEVVVTGYTSERKADIVTAISQVSALNTVAVPQGDIGQSLQGRVAGVQVTTSGQPGAASQVRIRGFGSLTDNRPLYVIDGVPTFDNTQVNPYDVESQTVLKDAGACAMYGARAAAGVIVITTKHGKYDGKTVVSLDMNTGVTLPGEGQKNLNPQQQANKVYEAITNSGGSAKGQPYGGDLAHPALPDYVDVGVPGGGNLNVFTTSPNGLTPITQATVGKVSYAGQALVDLAKANYNIDPSKGQLIQVTAANKAGTDWYKAMTRNAPVTRLSLGISGGNDRAHYYTNFSYFNQQGIAINQFLKRFNLRFNSEFKPLKNVRIGENAMLTYRSNPFVSGSSGQQGTGNNSGATFDENALNLAYRMPTIIPVHDIYGNWAGTQAPGFNNPGNPVAAQTRLNNNYNQSIGTQAFGNIYIEVDPIKHLTLRSSFGGEVDSYHFLTLTQQTYENAENTSSNNLTEGSGFSLNYTFTNTIKYNNKFGNHSIGAFGGYEAIKNNTGRTLQGVGLNPYSLDPNFISLTNTAASTHQLYSSPLAPYTYASFFGKVDYNWSEKYYLSVSARRDGSSLFGPQNRYGVFPSISGAWRISTENFMSGVTWVSDLKLRGGYGTLGNSNAILSSNPANQYTLYTGNPTTGYDINGTNGASNASGFIPLQVGNPAGKWETSSTTNIGLDGTFLNGTLDVILEVWQRKTRDCLYNPQPLNTAGVYSNYPFLNVAAMTNQGIDLQLIKRIKIDNDWSLTVDGNISPFTNKITAISPGQTYFEPAGGTVRNLDMIRNAVGQPMSSFYGYKMIGYFKDAADVASSPIQDGAAPGRFKFQNTTGSGTVNPNDRVFMGSPVPKFTYGLNVNAKYKNFFLIAFLYGSYGSKIMNFSKWYTDFYASFSGAALAATTLQSWTPELGNGAKTPIIESASNFSTNTQSNSWYMESGSYARLKNLQLGYDIPKSFLKGGLTHVKFYVQAINLFTITKYTGKDPELVGNVDTARGIDVGNYPATRQYMVGINVGF